MTGTSQPEPALSKNFLSFSQNKGATYSEQVIKNCCVKENKDHLLNSVPKTEDNSNPKTDVVPEKSCINHSEVKSCSHSNQNHNSTTNGDIYLNDSSKSSLPFFMPSIHFQLDWKPVMSNSVNAVEQKGILFTKDSQGICINGQKMEQPSGLTSRNSCNNLATATKKISEMTGIVQNPIQNKPLPSVSNEFKQTYNILKAGILPLYVDKTVQTCSPTKSEVLKVNQENNINTIQLPDNQNQPGTKNANINKPNVHINVNFSGSAGTKTLSDANGSERKCHMARFTKDPEFPSSLKAIDCEIVNFIQLNQMRKCLKQISQNHLLCNSVFGHDVFYYASCLSQNARNILVSEFPDAFNTWPQKNNSCLSAKSPECPKVQKMDKPLPADISWIKEDYDIVKSQQAGGDEKGTLNPKFSSYRWKHLFALLLKLPLNKQCVVDGILLPEQFKDYNINPR